MQSNNTSLWATILSFFTNLFSKRSAEEVIQLDKAETEGAIEKAEVEATVEQIKLEAKEQKKIIRKEAKPKKAIAVEKLKPGQPVYVRYPNVKKRGKIVYAGYDADFVYDQDQKPYAYDMVFNYHGRPIAKPGLIK